MLYEVITVHVNASCGGGGVCGKCRILVEDGQVAEGFSERLTDEDAAKGYRLACLARIESDVTIRIPVESSIDASALNKQVRITSYNVCYTKLLRSSG